MIMNTMMDTTSSLQDQLKEQHGMLAGEKETRALLSSSLQFTRDISSDVISIAATTSQLRRDLQIMDLQRTAEAAITPPLAPAERERRDAERSRRLAAEAGVQLRDGGASGRCARRDAARADIAAGLDAGYDYVLVCSRACGAAVRAHRTGCHALTLRADFNNEPPPP